ncbi:MAG: hypothetical protein HUK24_04770, partial [Sphaerochaetaceae bacterium]|nr:hypothetical protein [Sphaerochaetaceae bacterium]
YIFSLYYDESQKTSKIGVKTILNNSTARGVEISASSSFSGVLEKGRWQDTQNKEWWVLQYFEEEKLNAVVNESLIQLDEKKRQIEEDSVSFTYFLNNNLNSSIDNKLSDILQNLEYCIAKIQEFDNAEYLYGNIEGFERYYLSFLQESRASIIAGLSLNIKQSHIVFIGEESASLNINITSSQGYRTDSIICNIVDSENGILCSGITDEDGSVIFTVPYTNSKKLYVEIASGISGVYRFPFPITVEFQEKSVMVCFELSDPIFEVFSDADKKLCSIIGNKSKNSAVVGHGGYPQITVRTSYRFESSSYLPDLVYCYLLAYVTFEGNGKSKIINLDEISSVDINELKAKEKAYTSMFELLNKDSQVAKAIKDYL